MIPSMSKQLKDIPEPLQHYHPSILFEIMTSTLPEYTDSRYDKIREYVHALTTEHHFTKMTMWRDDNTNIQKMNVSVYSNILHNTIQCESSITLKMIDIVTDVKSLIGKGTVCKKMYDECVARIDARIIIQKEQRGIT